MPDQLISMNNFRNGILKPGGPRKILRKIFFQLCSEMNFNEIPDDEIEDEIKAFRAKLMSEYDISKKTFGRYLREYFANKACEEQNTIQSTTNVQSTEQVQEQSPPIYEQTTILLEAESQNNCQEVDFPERASEIEEVRQQLIFFQLPYANNEYVSSWINDVLDYLPHLNVCSPVEYERDMQTYTESLAALQQNFSPEPESTTQLTENEVHPEETGLNINPVALNFDND